jgi:hypothetical protein
VWWAIGRAFVAFLLPFSALAAFAWAIVDAYARTTEVAGVVVAHSVERTQSSNGSVDVHHLKVRATSGGLFDLASSNTDLDLPEGERVVLDVSTANGQVEDLRTETRSVDLRWVGSLLLWGLLAFYGLIGSVFAAVWAFGDYPPRRGWGALGVVLSAVAVAAVVSPFFLR